jgi:hypothetical protein
MVPRTLILARLAAIEIPAAKTAFTRCHFVTYLALFYSIGKLFESPGCCHLRNRLLCLKSLPVLISIGMSLWKFLDENPQGLWFITF